MKEEAVAMGDSFNLGCGLVIGLVITLVIIVVLTAIFPFGLPLYVWGTVSLFASWMRNR
jgi:hypothetical protein